jgi:excinuclease UvrABC nuclease subunit
LYIGRAQLTDGQNLRKRVKEYFQKYSRSNERPKISKMFRYWAKELFLAYYPLPDNNTVVNVEKDIINSLILPMNDLIPDKQIKEAVKAFQ